MFSGPIVPSVRGRRGIFRSRSLRRFDPAPSLPRSGGSISKSFRTRDEIEGVVRPSAGLSRPSSDVDPFSPHDASVETSRERQATPSLPFLLPARPDIEALSASSQPATGKWEEVFIV